MLKQWLRYILHSVGCLVLIFTLTASSCLTQSQIDKATKASGNIANYTGQVIALVKSYYDSGLIKIEVKDQIALQLKNFSIAGGDFNRLVASISKQYGDGTVPVAVWRDLVTHFNGLTKLFIDILTFIPKAADLKDSRAFKIITAAVLTIANILISVGHNNPMYRKIKQLVPNWQQIQIEVNNYELA